MTPKEKAQELYDKMENEIFIQPNITWEGQCKKCAYIVVNEVLNKDGYNNEFWKEVKKEIKKIK